MTGIIPVFVLKCLDVRKSMFLGGTLVTLAHFLSHLMITTDGTRQDIRNNSTIAVFSISVCGGQGASLILFACLQSILEMTTVLCCQFVSSLLIANFFGSALMFEIMGKGVLGSSNYGLMLVGGAFVYFGCFLVLADSADEDESGLMGTAASFSKGILNRRTSTGYIII